LLRASRSGARLTGSATDDEQANGEHEDDDLEGDGYGILEAAFQTLVAD
jgi:hypothetical protein